MYRRTPKIISASQYILKFDGCSKGNPGHSGAGAVLYKDHVEIWTGSKYIGNNKTGNQAEYSALIIGLLHAREIKLKKLLVCGDSLFVIKQMLKEYKVKTENVVELNKEALEIAKDIDYIHFEHIYREQNERADELANLSIINYYKNLYLRKKN
jgi:ribonuclease HI